MCMEPSPEVSASAKTSLPKGNPKDLFTKGQSQRPLHQRAIPKTSLPKGNPKDLFTKGQSQRPLYQRAIPKTSLPKGNPKDLFTKGQSQRPLYQRAIPKDSQYAGNTEELPARQFPQCLLGINWAIILCHCVSLLRPSRDHTTAEITMRTQGGPQRSAVCLFFCDTPYTWGYL